MNSLELEKIITEIGEKYYTAENGELSDEGAIEFAITEFYKKYGGAIYNCENCVNYSESEIPDECLDCGNNKDMNFERKE